jgi:hypothetical protein
MPDLPGEDWEVIEPQGKNAPSQGFKDMWRLQNLELGQLT